MKGRKHGLKWAALFLLVLVYAASFGAYSSSHWQQPPQPMAAIHDEYQSGNQKSERSSAIFKCWQIGKEPVSEFRCTPEVDGDKETVEIDHSIGYFDAVFDGPRKFVGRIFDDPVALFTAVLSIATILLFCSANKQEKLTREAINLSRKEFNSSHRPIMRVKRVRLIGDVWTNDKFVVDIDVVNIGNLPGTIYKINVVSVIIKSGNMLPPRPPYYGRDDIAIHLRQEIKPGLTFSVLGCSDGRVIPDKDSAEIRDGKKTLYCVGTIEYEDTDERIRVTAFCRAFRLQKNGASYMDVGRFMPEEQPDLDYEYQD